MILLLLGLFLFLFNLFHLNRDLSYYVMSCDLNHTFEGQLRATLMEDSWLSLDSLLQSQKEDPAASKTHFIGLLHCIFNQTTFVQFRIVLSSEDKRRVDESDCNGVVCGLANYCFLFDHRNLIYILMNLIKNQQNGSKHSSPFDSIIDSLSNLRSMIKKSEDSIKNSIVKSDESAKQQIISQQQFFSSNSIKIDRLCRKMHAFCDFTHDLCPHLLKNDDWNEYKVDSHVLSLQLAKEVPQSAKFIHIVSNPTKFEEGQWRQIFQVFRERLILWRMRIATSKILDEMVAFISHNFKLLVWLNLHQNGVTDSGAFIIARNLNHLRILDKIDNNKITGAGALAAASSLSNIRQLWIYGNSAINRSDQCMIRQVLYRDIKLDGSQLND